ncbi:MAG: thiamine biosynthesis protein ThiS [Candidatus Margulisiibacteriota bacterium]|nr:MAG: thiamine biosynthesis protein ThiS [Candidatus Margulisbacteria bacterium GWD2_39_127]OGI00881.1 MAG: thiamine biosynthesis protein ThiS [Candidatus Margulisbacteria bacterium GWF2_38_17]OGI08736.1 MAG: thiamine biosynthesis protein ThiS [Candidatus Margulisbacteria bacterium GWE2_39_32]PZM79447.1 MAG: thiamine biosynthesis protein ThiS [Candidatus Margulisiibacteriota bacterium]HAR63499.1 thiamine biosynthesis protein ThiS [Candidatus Margulisiibacteriota bacterium]
MNLIINGENREIIHSSTVLELLQELSLNPEITIVERNLEIVGKELYGNEPIAAGDAIEIIRFMGGG